MPGVEVEFIPDNEPREDIDLYLCSIYTRGWRRFKEFSERVGREKIIAGGYHPTALPEDCLPYAHKVVPGLCGDIESIIEEPNEGIHTRPFAPRVMHRDLVLSSFFFSFTVIVNYKAKSYINSIFMTHTAGFC